MAGGAGEKEKKGGRIVYSDCKVRENCQNYTCVRDQCWHCEGYKLYIPEDPKILSPAQVQKKEERKAEKARLKQSEASKRGKAAKRKGYQGEHEIVKLLQQYHIPADRVPLSGALKSEKLSCDITLPVNGNTKRGEVKRRKTGFATLYKWLNEDKHSNYLFMRQDNAEWLVTMSIQEFIELVGDSSNAPDL